LPSAASDGKRPSSGDPRARAALEPVDDDEVRERHAGRGVGAAEHRDDELMRARHEGEGVEGAHRAADAIGPQHQQQLAGGGVPQLDRLVGAFGGDQRAVVGHFDERDRADVRLAGADFQERRLGRLRLRGRSGAREGQHGEYERSADVQRRGTHGSAGAGRLNLRRDAQRVKETRADL
jgi:hypothetical protein